MQFLPQFVIFFLFVRFSDDLSDYLQTSAYLDILTERWKPDEFIPKMLDGRADHGCALVFFLRIFKRKMIFVRCYLGDSSPLRPRRAGGRRGGQPAREPAQIGRVPPAGHNGDLGKAEGTAKDQVQSKDLISTVYCITLVFALFGTEECPI